MNTSDDDYNSKIAADSSGNIYISYLTDGVVSGGTHMGNNDIAVAKLDTHGRIVWIKQNAIMNTIGSDSWARDGNLQNYTAW